LWLWDVALCTWKQEEIEVVNRVFLNGEICAKYDSKNGLSKTQPTLCRDLIVKHHVGSSHLGPRTEQTVAYSVQELSSVHGGHSKDALTEALESDHHQHKKQVN